MEFVVGLLLGMLLMANKEKFVEKRCTHGATSWYICPLCKLEHPQWGPFEGEGPYDPS